MKMNSHNSIFISILSIFVFLCTACGESGVIVDNREKKEFKMLCTNYQDLLSHSAANYQEISKKNAGLQNKLRKYLNDFTKSDNRVEVERILSETKEMELKLQQEQFDFSELEKQFKHNHTIDEANLEINDIKKFLRNYPQSIKSNDLKNKIETLIFKKFQLETAGTPQTISDINRAIQVANNYLVQFKNTGFKAQVNDKIKKIEAQRQSIYEMEFQSKIAELFKRMDARVMEIAKNAHPASKIESVNVSIISGDVSKAAAQVKVVREYIVNMRGAIMGINRYRVKIQVSGVILGTNHTGVSYNISGATKVSDYMI
jgi:hypothetical protein